ncbi:MAG: hypothetical protein IJ213_08920 [Bacteroidales bacterium]|nr:hypothetical protein [Bacteroidales bacterium]
MKAIKRIRRILLLLFIAVFTGLSFVSCSDDEEDNISTWICKVDDGTTITMKLYEKENKLYTTVDRDSECLLFFDETWCEYERVSVDKIKMLRMYGTKFPSLDFDLYWKVTTNKKSNTCEWKCISELWNHGIYKITKEYKFKKVN